MFFVFNVNLLEPNFISRELLKCFFFLQMMVCLGYYSGGLVEIMYYVMDAHSFYNFIYFILLIIVSTQTHTNSHRFMSLF